MEKGVGRVGGRRVEDAKRGMNGELLRPGI